MYNIKIFNVRGGNKRLTITYTSDIIPKVGELLSVNGNEYLREVDKVIHIISDNNLQKIEIHTSEYGDCSL